MAYKIDFTEANYVGRARRKTFFRLTFAAAVAAAVWGVRHVYTVYKEPTLNMKLAEYEAAALPVEEMNAAWDVASKEYNALLRYYRFLWASNPTNFLGVMASSSAPRLKHGFQPLRWTLKTGGECRLDYHYAFAPGDKAAQTEGLESDLVRAVTSIVKVVDGKVDVQGVLHENLLRVDGFNVSVVFSLPDVKVFPAKERTLTDCVAEIDAFRTKVQNAKIAESGDVRSTPATANAMMAAYLQTGKEKPGFPFFADVINVAGWFDRADRFIAKNRVPDDPSRRACREAWDKIGDARFPWQRYRTLDNDELVRRTKELGGVSDGVKRFKGFLDKQQADCRKKLEPFVNAYERGNVFNEPLIEADLRDRVARASGIPNGQVTFKDVSGAVPAVLETDDEKFTFTWVQWTLTLGGSGRPAEGQELAAREQEPITLAQLTDCVTRALTLGPGYVLASMKIDFAAGGTVAGAVLEGVLPVKTVELKRGRK